MDYVDFVEKNKRNYKDYAWLKQFDRNTDGERMTPLKFLGMKIKYGMEEIPDGILGERTLTKLLKTNLLKGDFDPAVLSRHLTPDEYNDVLNYFAWVTYDNMSLRATEGRSELVPRQEYEFLTFLKVFLRSSEIIKLCVHKKGWEHIVRRMFNTRREIGGLADQIAMGCWATIALPICGDVSLQTMKYVDPDDPAIIEKKQWYLESGLARMTTQTGGDGHLSGARRRYVWDKEPEVVDWVMKKVKPVDAKKIEMAQKFFAAAQLLSYVMHYDNRGGQGDAGPFVVEDGKPMVTRMVCVNEPEYPWCAISEDRGLPFSFVFCCVFNPEKINLKELRIIDISTVMTSPPGIMDALEKVAIFRRLEPDGPEPLPLDALVEVDWSEVPDWTNKCNEAIIRWYDEVGRMSKRDKINNALREYYWCCSSFSGFLRPIGMWDYINQNCDFWEWHPLMNEAYLQASSAKINETVGISIWTGAGWTDFTDKQAPESKYRQSLKKWRELGWVSDLTGTQPIPDDLKSVVDEDGILQVPLEINYDKNWLK